MFCIKCGNQLSENDVFCPKCGERVAIKASESERKQKVTQPTTQNRKAIEINVDKDALVQSKEQAVNWVKQNVLNDKKKLTILAVIAVVLVLIFFGGLGTPAYEKPIHNFMKAANQQNVQLLKQVFPVTYFSDTYQEYFDESGDELLYGMGEDTTVSAEVLDKTPLDSDDLEDVEEYLGWYCDDIPKITEGYELEVKMKVKYADGRVDVNEQEINVVKIGSKWYIDMSSIY